MTDDGFTTAPYVLTYDDWMRAAAAAYPASRPLLSRLPGWASAIFWALLFLGLVVGVQILFQFLGNVDILLFALAGVVGIALGIWLNGANMGQRFRHLITGSRVWGAKTRLYVGPMGVNASSDLIESSVRWPGVDSIVMAHGMLVFGVAGGVLACPATALPEQVSLEQAHRFSQTWSAS